jgi:hypothetical protein
VTFPGKEAGSVEVHVGVQVLPAEVVDLPGKDLGDMGISQVFATTAAFCDDRGILFHGRLLCVIVGYALLRTTHE